MSKNNKNTIKELPNNNLPVVIEDYDLEAAFLGGCLNCTDFLSDAVEILEPHHFYSEVHPNIWEKIKKAYIAGEEVNVISIRSAYSNQDVKDYITGLAHTFCHKDEGGSKPKVIKLVNLWKLRELKWEFEDLLIDLEGDEAASLDAKDMQDKVEGIFSGLNGTEQEASPSLEGRALALKEIEAAMVGGKLAGVTSGFPSIDKIIGGLGNSDLIILAGRPSMGKTALALAMAEATAKDAPVLFCSLEMSKQQIEKRRLSMETGVQVTRMREGTLTKEQSRTIFASPTETQFWIDDTPALSCDQLLSRARRLKRSHGLKMIVVDYLQLMSASQHATKQSTVAATTEISKKLKCIAKELDIPVLALSQLSRALESREDKRPQLSDLRDSGSIEQDADIVMFTFREEYYLERETAQKRDRESEENYQRRAVDRTERLNACANKAEVIVAKNRHGPIGSCLLRFTGETTKFEELNGASSGII